MQEQVFSAVENGAIVLTASRRLAWVLTRQFNSASKNRAKAVWKTPDILPLRAFLRRCWQAWIANADLPGAVRVLLGPAQELAVWEQIIRQSPEGESLLRVPETAQAASAAWELVQAYRLPLNGQFEASEDCAAFSRWAREFRQQCDSNQWLEDARLPDVIGELMRRGEVTRPSNLFLAGFDELTPQQREFLECLGEYQEFPRTQFDSTPQCVLLRDGSEEVQRAAGWARDLLERNPAAHIGVIVPNLAEVRSKVERIFRGVLHPGSAFQIDPPAFHLSFGRPLSEYAVIHAALVLLEFAAGPMSLPRIGALLRSPFTAGAEKERTKRAVLDVRLRKRGAWTIPLNSLRDEATHCPELQRVLGRVQKEIGKLAPDRFASDWSHAFSKILKAFGWPGDRTLNSSEYQVIEAWQRVLSEFATLSSVVPSLDYEAAGARLRGLAEATQFQMENEGAPIQIMGVLEASGLRFDHLWVLGLHDQALPGPARPNPFLPLRMQRQYELPHSTSQHELEFAKRLLARLLASAPDVVLSCPLQEGESSLEPSPLVPGDRWIVPREEQPAADWTKSMRAAAKLEIFTDEAGPPLPEPAGQAGGTWLFRDMAACPFRAFVQHRIGARPLDDAELGLGARDKGKLVHKALELIWGEVGSHEQLCGMSPGDLAELVRRNVNAALDQQAGGLGRSLERIRLQELLLAWLEIEKNRPPFTVLKPEAERIVALGGVAVKTRIDRIDELSDGRHVILDYKTGQVSPGGWKGDRLDEPQVPLYCVTSEHPVAAAAFVQIRAGELVFRGLDDSGSLPDLKPMRFDERLPLARQVEEWRRVLTALGERFRAGIAEVDPTPDACAYCQLTSLCRIREIESA